MFWLFYNLQWVHASPQLSRITESGLAPFPGCQSSHGIVENGPAGLVISFNIYFRDLSVR